MISQNFATVFYNFLYITRFNPGCTYIDHWKKGLFKVSRVVRVKAKLFTFLITYLCLKFKTERDKKKIILIFYNHAQIKNVTLDR